MESRDWVLAVINSTAEQRRFRAETDNSLKSNYPQIQAIRIDMAAETTPNEPIFLSEPDLLESRPGFFIRRNLKFSDNGSFLLPPD